MEIRRRATFGSTAHNRKLVIGLTGGVCSGKSTVAKIMGELGAGVIESDDLGHQELKGREVKDVLCRWWGRDVLAPDGSVDRQKVAAIVFADPSQRHRLEALLHPRIAVRRADMIAAMEEQPSIIAIVLDSPLLYEADLDLVCDAVVFVHSEEEIRKDRSENSNKWPKGELERREKSQQPLDIKRARADYVCENNSSTAALRKRVEGVFAQIVSVADAP